MIKITTPGRLHFGLIDMNGDAGRVDMGIGVALNKPNFVISVEEYSELKIIGGFDEEISRIVNILSDKFKINKNYRIKIHSSIPRHSGFGSTTQLTLAVAKCITEINEIFLDASELAKITGRGGTSGIGVEAFSHGGFILDCGHKFKTEKEGFAPSSFSKAPPPKILLNYKIPEDWFFVCAVPEKGKIYGTREAEIFSKFCPIPSTEVDKICRIVLVKILPAVIEKDIESFGSGLSSLQELGFKKVEVSLQSEESKKLINELRNISFGSGLSSFGPCIYSVAKGKTHAKEISDFLDSKGIMNYVSNVNNRGAFVEVL